MFNMITQNTYDIMKIRTSYMYVGKIFPQIQHSLKSALSCPCVVCSQEFVNIPPILVVDKGILCDYQQLMSKFSQMSGGGLYLWLVKPPRGRKWIAVYLGKGQKLGKRLQVYVHRSGVWGPSGEAEKQARMYDLQRRGFSVQLM